jgi:uncharacterized protein YkwD
MEGMHVPLVIATGDPSRCARPVAHVLLFIVALLCAMGVVGADRAAAAGPTLDPEERAMCQQINSYRAAKGLGALKVSVKLTKAAKWMSLNMATNDYFDHADSLGRNTFARLRSFGVRDLTAGENLAAGMAGASATFNQWRNDAPHRAGMLRAKFKVIGIGRAYSADSMLGWYWTTTFGSATAGAVAC